jgi:hypothetical protein
MVPAGERLLVVEDKNYLGRGRSQEKMQVLIQVFFEGKTEPLA